MEGKGVGEGGSEGGEGRGGEMKGGRGGKSGAMERTRKDGKYKLNPDRFLQCPDRQ